MEIRVGIDSRQGWVAVLGRELDEELLPVLLPTLLAALIIGALTLRDGLRPLQRLASAAAGIAPAVSERRLFARHPRSHNLQSQVNSTMTTKAITFPPK